MNQILLTQIEDSFDQLSISEQLHLIERLVHQVQRRTSLSETDRDDQLALMASDPEILTELERMECEFSCAESDGLENH